MGYGLPSTGYRLRALNHGVISFLHKPCSTSGYPKTGFINPPKRYRSPCAHILEKLEGRKKAYFSKNPKKILKKKILHEIESLTADTKMHIKIEIYAKRSKKKNTSELTVNITHTIINIYI